MIPSWMVSWWNGWIQKETYRHAFLRTQVFKGLETLYRAGLICRHWSFDQGLRSIKRAPIPVVSVGNIAVGGVGKTPVTLHLAALLSKSLQVAILSRGYGAQAPKKGRVPLWVSRGNGPECSVKECGDGPFLLAERLPSAYVICSTNRHQAAQAAYAAGAQVALLDDGFQHRQLHRDWELVLVDGRDPLAAEHLLPFGRLRDLPHRLRAADLILVTKELPHADWKRTRQHLAPFSSAPIVRTELKPMSTLGGDLMGSSVEILKGAKVALFSGIAKPTHFAQTVCDLGAEISAHWTLPDHRTPNQTALFQFMEQEKSRGARYLLCTEKDWVKLFPRVRGPLPVGVIPLQVCFRQGEEQIHQLVERIIQSASAAR